MSKKVAVITGASTGIGAGSAVQLAKDGFDLVIAARRKEKLEEVATQCRAEGAEVLVVPTDCTKEEDVKNLFAETKKKFGKMDFYFCNQGVIHPPRYFEEQTLDDYYLVSEGNFKSVFLCLVNAINFMKEQPEGNILVTGSSSGIRPEAGMGVYSASKHAVIGLVKDAAIECGRFNIRINCLCPGGVDTPMVNGDADIDWDNLPADFRDHSDAHIRRYTIPLLPKRVVAKVSEITGMVSFMASEQSTFMCGSVISVDCGITQ